LFLKIILLDLSYLRTSGKIERNFATSAEVFDEVVTYLDSGSTAGEFLTTRFTTDPERLRECLTTRLTTDLERRLRERLTTRLATDPERRFRECLLETELLTTLVIYYKYFFYNKWIRELALSYLCAVVFPLGYCLYIFPSAPGK